MYENVTDRTIAKNCEQPKYLMTKDCLTHGKLYRGVLQRH